MSGGERPQVVIVGIGNPDRGDDGFGSAVARLLRGRVPTDVRVLERIGDALALIEDWKDVPTAVVIDVMAPIADPGRIHRLDLTNRPLPIGFAPRSSHSFGVAETIELARSLGRLPRHLVAYLVEGEQFEPGARLSPVVVPVVEEVAQQVARELPQISQKEESRCHA